MGGAILIQTSSHAADGAASSSHGRGVSNQIQIATHAGVQAKAGPTAVHVEAANQETQLRAVHVGAAAVHVGAANQETQLRAVHVGAAAVQLGAANETQLRAVHVGAAKSRNQWQTFDMADAQTEHDMADVAVVEHPHPHEDEEHVEWGYFDEDGGTALDPVQVRAGVEREMAFMGELGVREQCDRPMTGKVWSTRWCYRRKGDTVRSRLVVRQFREGTDPSVHAGPPRPPGAGILLTLSAIHSLFAATADRFQCGVHAHQ